MNTGVLVLRSPTGTILEDTWSFVEAVPAGVLLRGREMSEDMQLVAASEEAAGSDESEPLAWSSSGPLGCFETACLGTTAAYAGPPSAEPRCRLISAAHSPSADNVGLSPEKG